MVTRTKVSRQNGWIKLRRLEAEHCDLKAYSEAYGGGGKARESPHAPCVDQMKTQFKKEL